ncbi:MAG: FAD-dependent oxidoreductase, partial [Paracoccaceae bacterium]
PYIMQGADGRVVFAIPYEEDFTLIGTTEREHYGPPGEAECAPEEIEYLCSFVNEYFATPVTPDDVVWTYSGVRPLYDDGASTAREATREFVLSLDAGDGAPLLNVFGGKITTYRKLAEHVLKKLSRVMTVPGARWTAGVPLAGGDFAPNQVTQLIEDLQHDYDFLTPGWAKRLIRCYGTEAREILNGVSTAAELGRDFGANLSEAELRWLMRHEFARTGEDVLWRRTKLGLYLSKSQAKAVDTWMRAARKKTGANP